MADLITVTPIAGSVLTPGIAKKALLLDDVHVFPHEGTTVEVAGQGTALLTAIKLARFVDLVPADFAENANEAVTSYDTALAEIRKAVPDFDPTSRITLMTLTLEAQQ